MVVLLLRPSRFQKEVVSGEDSSANHIVEAFMTCGGVHGICGAVDFTTMAWGEKNWHFQKHSTVQNSNGDVKIWVCGCSFKITLTF